MALQLFLVLLDSAALPSPFRLATIASLSMQLWVSYRRELDLLRALFKSFIFSVGSFENYHHVQGMEIIFLYVSSIFEMRTMNGNGDMLPGQGVEFFSGDHW